MLTEELKLNPIFRAPEEYDVYKLNEEKPARINKAPHRGLCKKNDDYGAQMLEQFRSKDNSTLEITRKVKEKQR